MISLSNGWADMDWLGKANSGLNLAGGVLSLADMLNNWGVQKDALKLNMKNTKQQMAQAQQSFDRNVARQDRSLAAMRAMNEKPVTYG